MMAVLGRGRRAAEADMESVVSANDGGAEGLMRVDRFLLGDDGVWGLRCWDDVVAWFFYGWKPVARFEGLKRFWPRICWM